MATWGGKRSGAGRKLVGKRPTPPHRARPELDARHPVHVVLRARPDRMRLRQDWGYHAVRRVLPPYLGCDDFRIVHVSIQHNHLHLLVEAADRHALTRGMQSFAINLARELGCGKMFAHRYSATQIHTPFHARHALAYILNNWRRHRENYENGKELPASIDPYSSAISFRGWRRPPTDVWRDYLPLDVSPPRTRMLRDDWLRFGKIGVHETPGPIY